MKQPQRIIVVHPDKQHSFMTAKAVKESGMLYKYITTAYCKKNSLTGILSKVVRGSLKKKLQAHGTELLDDSEVKQYYELLTLISYVLVRVDKKLYYRLKNYRDRKFGKKIARYCKKHCIDAVISFDVLSADLFAEIDRLGLPTKKILDMSAAYVPYMHDIFSKEIHSANGKSQLQTVLDSIAFKHWMKQAPIEALKSDAFLSASDFTTRSLLAYGVDRNKIFTCVYGMNDDFFSYSIRQYSVDRPLKCIYVGNINEQKGCRFLLETAEELYDKGFEISLVGAYDMNNLIVKECSKWCKFEGYLLKEQLVHKLHESDIMIFPSLSDGFGFAVLEAMACGVVPICSENAGVASVIENGIDGYRVEAGNSKLICDKLLYLSANRDCLSQMSKKAAEKAHGLKWENYYCQVETALKKILD